MKLYQQQIDVFDCMQPYVFDKFGGKLVLIELYLKSVLHVLSFRQSKEVIGWPTFLELLQSLLTSTFQALKSLAGARLSLICSIIIEFVVHTEKMEDNLASSVADIITSAIDNSLFFTSCPEMLVHTPFFDESVRMVLMQEALRQQQQAERYNKFRPTTTSFHNSSQLSGPKYWNETVMNQHQAVQELNAKRKIAIASFPPGTEHVLQLFQQWNAVHHSTKFHISLTILRYLSPRNNAFYRNVGPIVQQMLHPKRWVPWIDAKMHIFERFLQMNTEIVSGSQQENQSTFAAKTRLAEVSPSLCTHNYSILLVMFWCHQQAAIGVVDFSVPSALRLKSLITESAEQCLTWSQDAQFHRKQRLQVWEMAVFFVCHGVWPADSNSFSSISDIVWNIWQTGVQWVSTNGLIRKEKDRWRVQNLVTYLICHRVLYLLEALKDKPEQCMQVFGLLYEWVSSQAMLPVLRLYIAQFVLPTIQQRIARLVDSEIPFFSEFANKDLSVLLPTLFTSQEVQFLMQDSNVSNRSRPPRSKSMLVCPPVGVLLLGDEPKARQLSNASWVFPLLEWPGNTVLQPISTLRSDEENGVQLAPALPEELPLPNFHRWTRQDMLEVYERASQPLRADAIRMTAVATAGFQWKRDYFSQLPDELLLHICLYLSYRRVARLCRVSRFIWQSIRDSNALWQELYLRSFPHAVFLSELSIPTSPANVTAAAAVNVPPAASTTPPATPLVTYNNTMEECPTCLLASYAQSGQRIRPCKYRDERHFWRMRFQRRIEMLKNAQRELRKFRMCPVIGCDMVVKKGNIDKEMEKHLRSHMKK
jgi:hypothetical protein